MPYFDELYDENGRLRSYYLSVYPQWSLLSLSKRRELFKNSDRFFLGDYRLDPLPRIITPSEISLLKRGVEQRAQAILAFLCDYYGGGSRWKRLISPFTLKSIIGRNHRRDVFGKLKPRMIAFPYGPDIIRDRSGKWRVIEDSAGMIGGMGDLLATRQFIQKGMPNKRHILEVSQDPMDFFNRLSVYYQSKAREKKGIAILYLPSFKDETDHETQRLSRIFESVGIESVTPSDLAKRLIVEDRGIYLRSDRKNKRVGYLVLRSSPEDMDLHCFFELYKKYGKTISKKTSVLLLNQSMQILKEKSLKSALLKQQAWTNFSPGVQFVNDKQFGIYIDMLIRFYLKQNPILESIPAQGFAHRNHFGRWYLDQKLLNKVIRYRNEFVIKRVDEDGGLGVWIGQKNTRKQWEILRHKIEKEPEKFIVQKFEHLSVLENRIVDLRIHAHVDCEEIIISNVPWGRANWIHNNGKVNLRSNGFTSPIIVLR